MDLLHLLLKQILNIVHEFVFYIHAIMWNSFIVKMKFLCF